MALLGGDLVRQQGGSHQRLPGSQLVCAFTPQLPSTSGSRGRHGWFAKSHDLRSQIISTSVTPWATASVFKGMWLLQTQRCQVLMFFLLLPRSGDDSCPPGLSGASRDACIMASLAFPRHGCFSAWDRGNSLPPKSCSSGAQPRAGDVPWALQHVSFPPPPRVLLTQVLSLPSGTWGGMGWASW